jgi:cell division protein FtsW (lipid II flippase)
MRRERDGIRILGGVVACLAMPLIVVGLMATQHDGGHHVAYLAWIGCLVFFAGAAAFCGSLAAALVISALSMLFSAATIWILVRAAPAGTAATIASVTIMILLLLPAIVTARGWRRRSR